MGLSLDSMLKFVHILALLFTCSVLASPFGIPKGQNPFIESPPQKAQRESARLSGILIALDSLKEASPQAIETFEKVMAELSDISEHLTWRLPEKKIASRPTGWDYTVSSSVLPEHRLRIKQPNKLGVDDVKQVNT